MAKDSKKTKVADYSRDWSMSSEDFINDVIFGDIDKKVEAIIAPPRSTGSIPLDILLHGGIKDGDAIMLYSGTGVGKSTIYLQLCKNLIEQHGKNVLYFDVESGVGNQIEAFGLLEHIRTKRFGHCTSVISVDGMQKAFDSVMEKREKVARFNVIVIDSITALNPSTLMSRSVTDPMMASQAKEMTDLLKKYRPLLAERGITLLLVNQERANLKAQTKYDPAFKMAGCAAIGYAMDVTIRLQNTEAIKEMRKTINGLEDAKIGCLVRATAIKSRKGNGSIGMIFPLIYGEGISNLRFLIKMLKDKGYVRVAGAYLKTSMLPNPKGGEWTFRSKDLETWVKDNYGAIVDILDVAGAFKLMVSKDTLDVTDQEATVDDDDEDGINF